MTHFEGRVRSMASDGRGVVEGPEGRIYFVPAVWIGDFARFEIVENKKSFGRARVVEFLEFSTSRVQPECPHFGWELGRCGGCPWQFVSYEAQLQAKQERVLHALKKLQLDPAIIQKIWPSPKIWGYRNRAQFKSDGNILGFVSASSSTIAPIQDCLVLSDTNRSTLRDLLKKLPNPAWKPSRGWDWITLDIDEDLRADAVQPNKRRPFRQANEHQNGAMKEWLRTHLARLDKSSHVLELFAGSGNFTQVVASEDFELVCAVEVVDAAIKELKDLKLPNVITVEANLFEVSAYKKIRSLLSRADVLILDPPRDGLKDKTGLFKEFPSIKTVGYVSCDLATFARDLRDFIEQGFRVLEIQPLDQFPHTPHIEIMAWMQK